MERLSDCPDCGAHPGSLFARRRPAEVVTESDGMEFCPTCEAEVDDTFIEQIELDREADEARWEFHEPAEYSTASF